MLLTINSQSSLYVHCCNIFTTVHSRRCVLKSDRLTPESAFFWRAGLAHLLRSTRDKPTSRTVAGRDDVGDESGTDDQLQVLSADKLLELFQPPVVVYAELART